MMWERVKLADVSDSCLGKMLDQRKNKGIYKPYLANVNVRWGAFDLDNLQEMKFEDDEDERYGIKYGDLIICEGGEPGRCAIWKEQLPNMKIQKALHRLRVNEEMDYRYVYYWFLLAGKQGALKQYYTGATIMHMPGQKLKEVVIDKPPLDVQRKIGDYLEAFDDLIENNQKQIKLLEEAAQRLYKEWFVDLRFPGYEDVDVVDGVPEGWTYKRVEEFGEVITGKTPSTSKTEYYGGSIPFVTIPDMHGNVFPLVTEKTLTKVGADTQKNKYLPANTVIVSCIATVGLVNIAIEPCQTNQQINSVILHDDNNLYFFYESMKRIKTLLDGVGSNGATMTNVNKTKFSNIKVLYPTEDLVMKYNEFCKPIFAQILASSKAMLTSKQARDRLLPKLMSGEIEV
ncbi:restriction endonuclease subunit S [Anaerotignum faecicola]